MVVYEQTFNRMAYDHSTQSSKVMLFNICKLTVLKCYVGYFTTPTLSSPSLGVTQRMFAAMFNSRKA